MANRAIKDLRNMSDSSQDHIATLIGPSHVLRWRYFVESGDLTSVVDAKRMIGRGGQPVWSESFLRTARNAQSHGRIGVMVGDFRFGNSVALDEANSSGPQAKEFFGIERRAVSPSIDIEMVRKTVEGVKNLHASTDGQCRFVFWCAFGRQVLDRLHGRYITGGRYVHPSFNYAEVVEELGESIDVVDMSSLLRMPMHEISRLFVDSSIHPSLFGYRFLELALCRGIDARQAFFKSIGEVEGLLWERLRATRAALGNDVVITGRSIWIDTLARYLGATGAERLADEGIIIAPLTAAKGVRPLASLAPKIAPTAAFLVVSADGEDLSDELARKAPGDISRWKAAPVLDWETAAHPVILGRNETPDFVHGAENEHRASNLMPLDLSPGSVEVGPAGVPSFAGLEAGLEAFVSV